MECGTILLWFYLVDRSSLLPYGSKSYSRDVLGFIFLGLTLVAFFTSVKQCRAPVLLNRQQTEEWKGWMQVCSLLTHSSHALCTELSCFFDLLLACIMHCPASCFCLFFPCIHYALTSIMLMGFTPCIQYALSSIMVFACLLLACIPCWPVSCSLPTYSLHALYTVQGHALCLCTPCMHHTLSRVMLSVYVLLACIICCPVSCSLLLTSCVLDTLASVMLTCCMRLTPSTMSCLICTVVRGVHTIYHSRSICTLAGTRFFSPVPASI